MKISAALLAVAFAGIAVCALPVSARVHSLNQPQETKAKAKDSKLQGHVVRIYSDSKTIDLRGGATGGASDARKIAYDDSTEWTKMGKPGKMEEVKEGSFIIVVGHMEKDGAFHATRVDLRLPR